jgi:hypothetical protein
MPPAAASKPVARSSVSRSRVAGALVVVAILVGGLLGAAPAPARVDGPQCGVPAGLVAHPGRTRIIDVTCAGGVEPQRVLITGPILHATFDTRSPSRYVLTPDVGYTGPVSFTVEPGELDGPSWPSFTVTVTVSETENAPPDCSPAAGAATHAHQSVALGLAAWCPDPEGDPVTFAVVDPPGHGHLAPITGASGTYTPASGFLGTDTFTFTATDDRGATTPGSATVRVDADPYNNPPLCSPAPVLPGQQANEVVHGPRSILVTCRDPDGDPLTLTFPQPPSHGSVVVQPSDADGQPAFLYAPDAGYFGIDTLTLRVEDGRGGSAQMTRRIAVGSAHWPECPIHTDVAVAGRALAVDRGVTIPLPCTDADGDHLSAYAYYATAHGTVTFDDAAGTLTYTPDVGFTGDDDLGLEVDDGRYGGNFGWVHFHVAAPGAAKPGAAKPGTAIARAGRTTAADATAQRAAALLGARPAAFALGVGAAARGFVTTAARVKPGAPLAAVFCAKACAVRVGGRLTLDGRALALSRRTLRVAAGRGGVVRLRLSSAQRHALAHARRASVRLTLETNAGGKRHTASRTFLVRRP